MDKIANEFFQREKLCDSIYRFYQPKVPIQLEVVFIHGLEHDNYGDAYWKTWLARDGLANNIWPMTWLPEEFPSTKVLALKYDASVKQTATNGRMDLFLLGEKLVQEMVMFGEIGQNGVPVVFVCHGFGGLVAKQIVISAKHRFSQDSKAQILLKNIEAFLFYSTPHHGSHIAKSSLYFYSIWGGGKGPLLENLEVLNTNISRLNDDFEQVAKAHSWYYASAAETHITKPYGEMVAEEASTRIEGGNYLALSDDHFDVVRPKTKMDSSYLWLTNCLKKVLVEYVVKLGVEVESPLPDGFVRLEVQEETIKRKLQEVSIVGLVGMGGIGKTTLVRAVYQSIHKDFEGSCYLDDIKSKANLDEVLIRLLQNFGIKDRKTGCIVEESHLQDCKNSLLEDLKMYVREHKVLVVVDDVGTKKNFNCLLKDMDFLNGNKESKIIVTCRNWQELKDYVQGSGKYEVEPMNFGQDSELFAYHAFKGATTLEERREKLLLFLSKDSSEGLIDDFESKYNDIVKACGGLPLSLEVMGCCLGGYLRDGDLSSIECLECWRGALEKLVHAEPLEGGIDNDRLWTALRISYDCLHENEQNMFLDIACFFCNSMRYGEQTLLRIWGGKPSKLVELRNLKERCLVKINEKDKSVTTHDQLRDMGRSVVRQQCKRVLSKMTRLWDFEDVSKVLQSNEIIALRLQGLSLDESSTTSTAFMEYKSIGTSKRLKISNQKGFSLDCPTLRLLNLHEVGESVIEALSIKNLSCIQWLCLKGIFISKLPKFVQVCNDLCVLDLRECRYLKNLDGSIAKLVNLLELNLSACMSLASLPNSIGKLVNLLTLDLSRCSRLTSLPHSIGDMVKLTSLNLSYCTGLTSLPDSIGNMVKLSTFYLSDCMRLASLPHSIGRMAKLTSLDLSNCKRLIILPDSVGKLVNLWTLNLSQCKGITSLPHSIGDIVKLIVSLNLSYCMGLTSLSDSIGNMVKLTSLDLSYCKQLTSLPDSVGKLVNLLTLNLSHCNGLTSLPHSFGDMVKLTGLDLSDCEQLISLPDSVGKLVNLLTLNLSRCKGLTSLPHSIGEMVKLTRLDLSRCKGLKSLPNSIGKLVNPSKLYLPNHKPPICLSDFNINLVKLCTLDISGCIGLKSLPDFIGDMVNITSLDLSCSEGLTNLPNYIGHMVNLTNLNLSYCEQFISLPDSIGKLVNLSTLILSHCKGLTSLPHSIGHIVKLTSLDLCDCEQLISLPDSVGKLVNLLTLNLSRCKGLTSLPHSIGHMVKLTSLDLCDCEQLISLPNSVGKLVNLSTLNLSRCKGLTSLPHTFGDMVKLISLDLSNCERLTSLPDSVGKLVNLLRLDLLRCKGLTSLPHSIGYMVKLTSLDLFDCERLISLPNSVGKLVNLLTLNLSRCKELTSLPHSFGDMVKLTSLDLSDCERLISLPNSVGKLVNLLTLNLSRCKGLISLPHSIGDMVKLTSLGVSDCERLISLPDSIGKLVNLWTLNLSYCKGITSLPHSIGNMVKLTSLDLSDCERLISLPDSVGKLVNLLTLNLSRCKGLTSLPHSTSDMFK